MVSPAITGTPTAPSAASTTYNTQIATTAFVQNGLAGKVDKTYVDAQLDNKVDCLKEITSGNIKDIINLPTGNYLIGPQVIGMPINNCDWLVKTISDGTNISISAFHLDPVLAPAEYQIYGSFNAWSSWKRLATIESPAEFALPLMSGFTKTFSCSYSKNQFNEVIVKLAVDKVAGISYGEIASVLPAGFRPKETVSVPCYYLDLASKPFTGCAYVNDKGEISLYVFGGTMMRAVASSISFIAVN